MVNATQQHQFLTAFSSVAKHRTQITSIIITTLLLQNNIDLIVFLCFPLLFHKGFSCRKDNIELNTSKPSVLWYIVVASNWDGRILCGTSRSLWPFMVTKSIINISLFNQSINQTSIAPISLAKPGSVAQQPNQCSTAKFYYYWFSQSLFQSSIVSSSCDSLLCGGFDSRLLWWCALRQVGHFVYSQHLINANIRGYISLLGSVQTHTCSWALVKSLLVIFPQHIVVYLPFLQHERGLPFQMISESLSLLPVLSINAQSSVTDRAIYFCNWSTTSMYRRDLQSVNQAIKFIWHQYLRLSQTEWCNSQIGAQQLNWWSSSITSMGHQACRCL